MTLKKLALLFLSACMVLTMAACNNSPASTPTPTPTPTATPTPAPTSEPTATPDTPKPSESAEPSATPEPSFPIDADRTDAIYNEKTHKAIWLGMTQEDLESNYDPQEVSKTGYTPYDDFGFFVKYWGNNTVLEFALLLDGDRTTGSNWSTSRGLKVGDTREMVDELYDAPTYETQDVYFYYFIDGKLLFEMPNLAKIDLNKYYSMRIMFTDDVVTSISFVRFE